MGGWQIAWICIMALSLGSSLANHGKYKTGKHNFWACLIALAIETLIVVKGGFFN